MARGSVVDESRMITAKILVTPHQGYLDYEQLKNKLTHLPIVVRGAHHFVNLDDDDASLCCEQGEESALNESSEF